MSDPSTSSQGRSHDRMLPNRVGKRLLLSVTGLCLMLLVAMEIKARQDDYPVNYPRTSDLWVGQWYRLDELPEDQTVFIGSSKVKHGIIVNEWEKQTGIRPLNLAWAGSPAGPVLTELAARESFKGTVICEITPFLVFANDDFPFRSRIHQNIRLSKTSHLSLSFHLSLSAQYYLRPHVKLMNSKAYSPLANLYRSLAIPDRAGILKAPIFRFLWTTDRDLQGRFLDSFENDVEQQQAILEIFRSFLRVFLHYGACDIDKRLSEYVMAAEKITRRGGRVIFVHLPISGSWQDFEETNYPRATCYDRLIEKTGCLGIHYEDYPQLRDMKCVDEVHLSKADGILFTQRLIEILRGEGVIE